MPSEFPRTRYAGNPLSENVPLGSSVYSARSQSYAGEYGPVGPGAIGPGLVIEGAGRRSFRFQQSLRHRQEIDKFPASPKKARVSYQLAAFATRKPAPFLWPLSFREWTMSEVRFPGMILLGSSVNKGNPASRHWLSLIMLA